MFYSKFSTTKQVQALHHGYAAYTATAPTLLHSGCSTTLIINHHNLVTKDLLTLKTTADICSKMSVESSFLPTFIQQHNPADILSKPATVRRTDMSHGCQQDGLQTERRECFRLQAKGRNSLSHLSRNIETQ